MEKTKYREIRGKRGIFGWLFLLLFIGFNILMISSLIAGIEGSSEVVLDAQSDAERVGASIGVSLGIGFLLMIWAIGDIILGIPVLMTRPSKTLVSVED